MKLFAPVIAVITTAIALLFVVFFIVTLTNTSFSRRACIEMAVELTNLGSDDFEVPDAIYAEFERLCLVDIRPEFEDEEDDGGEWF